MSELTNFTNPYPDLTNEEHELLRRAGASEKLIRVCNTALGGVDDKFGDSVDRHSVLHEVKKYLREWESLTEESADDFSHYGGHFFTKLWNGDLWGAYSSADVNNKAILKATFGLREINQARPKGAVKVTA